VVTVRKVTAPARTRLKTVPDARPRKRVPRAEREAQMLAAAEAVFAAKGFHAATVDDIAERIGVTRQMVFAYFGSKDQLFMTIYRRASEDLARRIDEAASHADRPDRQLWEGARAFLGFVDERRDAWSIVHDPASQRAGPLLEEVSALRGEVVRLIAQLFAEAWEGSGRPATGELEPAAIAVVGAAEALASWWLDHPEETREAMELRLMNLLWMGLGDLMEGRTWAQ
jgi:AcrR family transcriptional regulator